MTLITALSWLGYAEDELESAKIWLNHFKDYEQTRKSIQLCEMWIDEINTLCIQEVE